MPGKEKNKGPSPEKLEEWKMLRGEIARKQDAEERILISAIAANGVIYSFSLNTLINNMSPLSAFLPLMPIIIFTLAYFWILRNVYSVTRIVHYLVINIEKDTEFAWETWLRNTRIEGIGMKPVYEITYWLFYLVSLSISLGYIWFPYLSPTNNFDYLKFQSDLVLTGIVIIATALWAIIADRRLVRITLRNITIANSILQEYLDENNVR
jgi:general stress protein CsbA